MARRRPKKHSVLNSEFARPLGALVLLALLWGAYKIGIIAALVAVPFGILVAK